MVALSVWGMVAYHLESQGTLTRNKEGEGKRLLFFTSFGFISASQRVNIKMLTPREAKVLKLRFGLEDGKARTLEEVGKQFNVTRERIRQIEAKALRKLRHPSRSNKLKEFM